jgi:hypothetical protein
MRYICCTLIKDCHEGSTQKLPVLEVTVMLASRIWSFSNMWYYAYHFLYYTCILHHFDNQHTIPCAALNSWYLYWLCKVGIGFFNFVWVNLYFRRLRTWPALCRWLCILHHFDNQHTFPCAALNSWYLYWLRKVEIGFFNFVWVNLYFRRLRTWSALCRRSLKRMSVEKESTLDIQISHRISCLQQFSFKRWPHLKGFTVSSGVLFVIPEGCDCHTVRMRGLLM